MEEMRATRGSPKPAGPVCEPRQSSGTPGEQRVWVFTGLHLTPKGKGRYSREKDQLEVKAHGTALGKSLHLFGKIQWR